MSTQTRSFLSFNEFISEFGVFLCICYLQSLASFQRAGLWLMQKPHMQWETLILKLTLMLKLHQA